MTISEQAENTILVEEEMKASYLDYAMSVIVSRALPDVRDGLKPVHHRILYAMDEGGYTANKPYRKSARIVGDVMGKYHPHGNDPIYEAMVRMKQEFSMNLPLIDGQGNFGSMDGDSPAAMRYTEARLAKSATVMLEDIDKDTVNFRPNYDESAQEPEVLPVVFPNLLVNGGNGIAVGMATSIAPHNLQEVCTACLAYLHDPDISDEALIDIVPGPDFPTGAQIIGRRLSRHALMTGKGLIKVRGTCEIEEQGKGRHAIVCTAIPYQVNKSRLVEKIAEVVRDKTIEGVSDLRDESAREGVRIVIDLKKEAIPELILKQIYHHTPMQTTFSVNMLALDGVMPRHFNLKQAIEAFVAFRDEVIYRRTSYLLLKARERGHVVIGLMVAIGNLDEVIALIRASKDRAEASYILQSKTWVSSLILDYLKLLDEFHVEEDFSGEYRLSQQQVQAILDLRLHRLTGLEREKLESEARELADKIQHYFSILESKTLRWDIIKDEITVVCDTYGVPRRSVFVEDDSEIDVLDLVAKEDMVVVVTHGGYVKRVPLKTYRAQKRGGKGRAGMTTKEDDGVANMFVATTHAKVLFFSSFGRVYLLDVYKLPLGTPQSKGKALVNQLPLSQDESVTAVLCLPEEENSEEENPSSDEYLVFATAKGYVRRNRLSDFQRVKANGKTAMKLAEEDRLVAVKQCGAVNDIFLSTRRGMAVRFSVNDIRVFQGRNSVGVRGVRLDSQNHDAVVGMEILHQHNFNLEECSAYLKRMVRFRNNASDQITEKLSSLHQDMYQKEQLILSVTDDGMGRLYSAYDYRTANRGGKGILNVRSKSGANVVSSFVVEKDDQIMLIADDGQIIRMGCDKIRHVGRPSQGVKLFDLGEKTKVASVVRLVDIQDDGFEEEDSNLFTPLLS